MLKLHRLACAILMVHLFALQVPGLVAQEWPFCGGDAGGTRYSRLEQINKKNVTQLKVAWIYDTGDVSDGTEYPTRSAFEATPLVINGVLYVTTPFCRLIALDAESGQKLWDFDPQIDRTMRINLFVSRGVTYWSDDRRERLFLGDLHGRLFSIDAKTGKLDLKFGKSGMLDLKPLMAEKFLNRTYALTSPSYDMYGADRRGANLYGNSLVCLSCKTGQRKWHFQTVHHDLWDYDLASQPVLVGVRRNGKDVPAVAQVTKMGFLFLFHRL